MTVDLLVCLESLAEVAARALKDPQEPLVCPASREKLVRRVCLVLMVGQDPLVAQVSLESPESLEWVSLVPLEREEIQA